MRKCLAAALVLMLAGCGSSVETEKQRLRADRAELMYKRLSERVDETVSAVSDLRAEVARLDAENWRYVVPDLKVAMDEVEAASQGASYEAAP